MSFLHRNRNRRVRRRPSGEPSALARIAGRVRIRVPTPRVLTRFSAWLHRPAPLAPAPADAGPRGLDSVLLASVLALLGLGMVMVYSSSAIFAASRYGSQTYFLQRNLVYSLVGLLALYAGWRLDYSFYQRYNRLLLLASLASLAFLLVPGVGTRVDGAVRWYRLLGLSFQPSEPAKLVLVIYLAASLARKRDEMRIFSVGFFPHMVVAGAVCVLVVKQPDLGTTAVLGAAALVMLFVAGTKLSFIVISLLACAPVGYQLIVGTPWRLRRLLAFLDPWAYRSGAGYQISESLISIGSGGLHGLGLGDGKQKLFFLPAAHTDFIFAQIGEELGLVGLAVVVGLFLMIVIRGLRAALGARDLFGTYLAFGITAITGLQAVLHMCVVLGLVPTKGITLPLVSYGGTALVSQLFCMGVLLNVAARKPEPPRLKVALQQDRGGNKRRVERVVVAG